jgi:MoaA/NifB/PqqE/SkfB family radical SAM enzyme
MKNCTLSGYRTFPFSDFINAKRIVRHDLIARTVRENRYLVPCQAGRLGAAIFAQGDVLPCELHTDMVMGNLRKNDYDFRKIWFGQKADEFRKAIRRQKCFCTYECFHTLNILFNPRMLIPVFRQWAGIKWARVKNRFGGVSKSRARGNIGSAPIHARGNNHV